MNVFIISLFDFNRFFLFFHHLKLFFMKNLKKTSVLLFFECSVTCLTRCRLIGWILCFVFLSIFFFLAAISTNFFCALFLWIILLVFWFLFLTWCLGGGSGVYLTFGFFVDFFHLVGIMVLMVLMVLFTVVLSVDSLGGFFNHECIYTVNNKQVMLWTSRPPVVPARVYLYVCVYIFTCMCVCIKLSSDWLIFKCPTLFFLLKTYLIQIQFVFFSVELILF